MEELPSESVEKLANVTKLLRTQRTLPAKLETVVAIVKRTIDNCDAAGISLLTGDPRESSADRPGHRSDHGQRGADQRGGPESAA